MGDGFPYRLPHEDAVRAGGWQRIVAGSPEPLPEWIGDWDLSQTLTARRRIDIDVELVKRSASLPADARLAVSVTYESAFDEVAKVVTLDEDSGDGSVSLDISVELPGHHLAGSVLFVTSLVLSADASAADAHIAHRRGSVLWQDRRKVRLQGDTSQFPVAIVDFATAGRNPGAPWELSISEDLDGQAMGAIQLLINEGFPLVVDAVRDLSTDRAELRVIRSVLFADIGRVLIEYALVRDVAAEQEWAEDSLGAMLSSLVRTHFEDSPEDLRLRRDDDPVEWNSMMAAGFRFLRA